MFDEPGFLGSADPDDAAPTLCTFVYCSRAAEGVDEIEVGRIVVFAQRRAQRAGGQFDRGPVGDQCYDRPAALGPLHPLSDFMNERLVSRRDKVAVGVRYWVNRGVPITSASKLDGSRLEPFSGMPALTARG